MWELGFLSDSEVKNLPANTGALGDTSLIPGWGRSPEGGNGNPLQYSCLENPMDRGAWQARIHGVAESRMRLATEHKQRWESSWVASAQTSSSRKLPVPQDFCCCSVQTPSAPPLHHHVVLLPDFLCLHRPPPTPQGPQ